MAMVGFAGVILRDTSDAGFTVSRVDPETLPDVAVIVAEPAAIAVARPFDPAALLMVAMPVFEELHITDEVRFCVVLSEKVAVAVNCCFVPLAIDGAAGVTVIETSVAAFTLRTVDPDISPELAVIVALPPSAPVATPLASIVATQVSDEFQAAVAVRSCVVLSEKTPVAVNC